MASLSQNTSVVFKVTDSARLDTFLAECLDLSSRTKIASAIKAGLVTVDSVVIEKPSHKLKAGNLVTVEEIPETAPHDIEPVSMDLNIVYEDAEFLVVDKPRGLVVHPAKSVSEPTLVHGLLARGHGLSGVAGSFRPGIVHRLDKETTGLIVVAKNDFAHANLAQQVSEKSAVRRYVALVYGQLVKERFAIEAPIGRDPEVPIRMATVRSGKSAKSQVKVLRIEGGNSLVAVQLETGRTHQIRVHLASIGHPVIGDSVYATVEAGAGPMQLHSALLTLIHPKSGEVMTFFAPPPSDFIIDGVTREEIESWT